MVLPLATSDNALIRERASLIAVMILDDIAAFHEQHGNYQLAIRYLEQWADIDQRICFHNSESLKSTGLIWMTQNQRVVSIGQLQGVIQIA